VTATLIEEEIRQKHNEQIAEFVMPKPCRGQAVTWYASGTRSGVGEMAFVLEVGRRNIIVNLASGVNMETVRHIDDPKLQLSAEQRESGAWDFTEDSKIQLANVKRIDTLEAKVAALEELFREPSKKKADKS
jgi:hypothetical protein